MKKIVFPILMMLSTYCHSGELATSTTQEITHLIAYLENSGCQFNRNGSWHEAKDASAASESSLSGNPYQVKCNGSEPVESASWFKAELANYRKNNR